MYIECISHPRWNLNEQTRENTVAQNIVENIFIIISTCSITQLLFEVYRLIFYIIIPFYFAGNF